MKKKKESGHEPQHSFKFEGDGKKQPTPKKPRPRNLGEDTHGDDDKVAPGPDKTSPDKTSPGLAEPGPVPGAAQFHADYLKLMINTPLIPLNAEAKIGDKYKYKYADLAGIVKGVRSIVNACNFVYYWTSEPVALVTCHLVHVSGKEITATCEIPVAAAASGYVDPKAVGAAITYARRYTLSCVLGIITDEDPDGSLPEPQQPKGKKKPKLDSKAFEQAKARIAKGNTNVVAQCLLYFDLTEAQEHELQNLELDMQANQDTH